MRIGFVTQWFPPEPGTAVASEIALGLGERGHQVEVLTGFPNYPSGRVQEGFSIRPYKRENLSDQVTVHRAALYPSHNASAIQRAANYLSFAIGASWVARVRMPRPDVWLVYSSPATAALPALLSARQKRAPVVLLIQDLWPDSVIESGLVQGVRALVAETLLARYCRWTYRSAAGVGVISPGMKPILIARGLSATSIHVTENWLASDSRSHSRVDRVDLREALQLPAGRLFMYAGNLGELQGLDDLIAAFSEVPEASLVLVGDGIARERLVALVASLRIANVSFVESQPSEEVKRYIQASDVQVVSLRDTALLRATMPSKVQGAMAAGRALLAHCAGDVAELVRASRSGVACVPGDKSAAVRAIKVMSDASDADLKQFGLNARRCYETKYSREIGLDRMEALLNSAL